MNKYIYILIFGAFLASCGVTKEKKPKEKPAISRADYPYIDAFHKGIQYKVQGRVDEAITEFEKCLRIRQDDDAVYFALSKLELERGNAQKSSEYIKKANEIDPENVWYIEELAYMYFELGQFENSVTEFRKLTKIEPRNINWMYGLSEALMNSGQDKEAIEVFNKMEDQTGPHPHFALQRYNIYMKSGKTSEAEQELLRAKDKFPQDPGILGTLVDHYYRQQQIKKAEQVLEELVKADPSNGRAHLALADVYQRRNEMGKAFESLRLAFESDDLDIDTKMGVLINIQEQSEQIPAEMFPIVEAFVQKYPNNAKSHSIQGDYLMQSGDTEAALVSYKNALELDNSLYPIWNQVLVMEYQNENFTDLYTDSKECLKLFPSIPSIYLLNGISANRLEKYQEALDALAVGIEMVVNDAPMKAEFYGQQAEAHFGLRSYSDMITLYKKAMMTDSKSSLLKNNFARRLALVKKELPLALSLAEQITIAFPDESVFLDTRGLVNFQNEAYEEAIKWFRKAIVADGDNVTAIEHMGDALFKQNKKEEALEFWNEAKEMGGGSTLLEKKINDKKFYEPEL